MCRCLQIKFLLVISALFCSLAGKSQVQITEETSAQALAQELVGKGVIISNATITATSGSIPAGFFKNMGGINLGIDSGIVLTSGRAKSNLRGGPFGINGNGLAKAKDNLADNDLGLPGDLSLAAQLGIDVSSLYDAIALEFDFIPLGDSIKFNYVFSSEEYHPATVCQFNDAFGFFISGPGITGEQNIALIPGTSTPVTIKNVNNIINGLPSPCISYPQYFISDTGSVLLIHDGRTTVFTAVSKVQPCEIHHLKLVIADQGDHAWDSGVFLEAKSLTSSAPSLSGFNIMDNAGNKYLAEGCATGTFNITRPKREPSPLLVPLRYEGSAVNGVDIALLPSFVTIPPGENSVTLNISALPDALAEGIETFKILAIAGCPGGLATDSIVIQIKDFDTLAIQPPTASICRKGSIELTAHPGYDSYQWKPDHTLSDLAIYNPVATPSKSSTIYTCTATEGTCQRQDSVTIHWITPDLKVFAGRDTIAAMGLPIQLQAVDVNNAGIVQCEWSSSSLLDDPMIANPMATLTSDQRFVVTATSADGCKGMDDVFIKVYKGPDIYVPTGFTPNNDGLNDMLKPVAVGIKQFNYFRIYNRWGQLMYSSSDPLQGWDGKLKSVEQPTATYIWMAEGIDISGNRIARKGVVTVIR